MIMFCNARSDVAFELLIMIESHWFPNILALQQYSLSVQSIEHSVHDCVLGLQSISLLTQLNVSSHINVVDIVSPFELHEENASKNTTQALHNICFSLSKCQLYLVVSLDFTAQKYITAINSS